MPSGWREPADGAAHQAAEAGDWPLVGRAREVGRALAALADQRGVVLVGEAGTGKTRLASEVVAATSADGLHWHQVIGSQGAARVPLGAWSHLLPDHWEPGGDVLATWRVLATGLEPSDGAIHLFVDDAQWLDPASAGLVHHLVALGKAKAIVTLRRGEGSNQSITALWKDGLLLRHDLEQFEPEGTAEVLEVVLGAPVEPRTARRLHDRSTGNLLMLRELVVAGLADRSLQLCHGAWVQGEPTRPSARLADLLTGRIVGLAADERAGAELVAVAEPIAADLLDQAIGAELVRRLIDGRVIEVERVGGRRVVRSSHPLVAEVLVDHMDVARREDVVHTLVDLFEGSGSVSDADLVRTLVWRLDIGLPIDGAAALQGTDLALARSDFALAEELARVALAAGEGPAATIRLGEALDRQQRHADAEAVFASVADQLDELDPWMRLRYADGRAIALSTDLGRVDEAVAVLEGTLATMPDGRARWALEARLAFVLSDRGRLRAAAPLADARLAGVDEDEVSALGAVTAYAMIRTLSGRAREALDALDAMVPVAMRHVDDVPAGIGWIAAQRMLALYFLGELAECAAFAGTVEAFVIDDADPTRRAAVLMVRGMVAADAGRLDEGLRLLQQSAALHEVDNTRGYLAWTLAILSRVHAQRGEVDEAERALAQARQRLWPGGQVIGSDLDAASLWVEVLRGRHGRAEEVLAEAVARTDAEGMAMVSAYLRHEAIRAGLPSAPHLDALAEVASEDQGRRVEIWHAHATALAADDGAGIVEAGHRLAALGTHLVAAEAFARAAGAHRRAGSPALAAQAKELSRQQLTLCPGARTPALRLGDVVVGLTSRELDVATRAAGGQKNHEIAEALGISVRTVETHLQRSFVKLGINRRAELAPLLHPD